MTASISRLISYTLIILTATVFSSCYHSEDPGPIQETEKEYSLTDFDRLEMGDAFNIDVEQGNYFEISVRGDRRNLDDLVVRKEGSTLIMRFKDNRNRRHDTYINITMPVIASANFTGASDSRVSGFHDLSTFDFYLSGASVSQLDVNAATLNVVLSGASYLNLRGTGDDLQVELSGASVLKAFNFPVTDAGIRASGASDAHVTASNSLEATASGASMILYRGNPTVIADLSGSSSVRQE